MQHIEDVARRDDRFLERELPDPRQRFELSLERGNELLGRDDPFFLQIKSEVHGSSWRYAPQRMLKRRLRRCGVPNLKVSNIAFVVLVTSPAHRFVLHLGSMRDHRQRATSTAPFANTAYPSDHLARTAHFYCESLCIR